MGIFDFLKKKTTSEEIKDQSKPTLAHDIPVSAEWAMNNLNKTGYTVDYNLERMKEIDRFFDEQSREGGVLTGKCGNILFSLASLVGETIIKMYGGKWITNDEDPAGEVNIAVELPDGRMLWPAQRCIKRLKNGPEDSIHDYVWVLSQK